MDRSDRILPGLAQRRHNYSSSTRRRCSGELGSWNWAGQWLPRVSNIYLCNPFSVSLCVRTLLRTLLLTTGGAAGCLWLSITNDQAERQHRQISENLALLQSPNLQKPQFVEQRGATVLPQQHQRFQTSYLSALQFAVLWGICRKNTEIVFVMAMNLINHSHNCSSRCILAFLSFCATSKITLS